MAISIVNPFVSDNNPALEGSEVNFSMEATANGLDDFAPYTGGGTVSSVTATSLNMAAASASDYEIAKSDAVEIPATFNYSHTMSASLAVGGTVGFCLLAYDNTDSITHNLAYVDLGQDGVVTTFICGFRLDYSGVFNVSQPIDIDISGDVGVGIDLTLTQGATVRTRNLAWAYVPAVGDYYAFAAITQISGTSGTVSGFSTNISLPITYSIEKDSVEIATTNTYQIASFASGDAGSYEGLASDDGGTTWTSLGTVSQAEAVSSKSIEYSTQELDFKAGIGYKTEYELNMFRVIDSLGMIKWVDMGKTHDTFKASLKTEMVDHKILEEILKGQYTPDYFTANDISGFYPFTPYFDYSSGVRFALVNLPQPKEVNLYGDASQYDFEIIPAYDNDIFTDLAASGVIPDCGSTPENWQIDTGLWLPYPENMFNDVTLNQTNIATQTNGGYNSTYHIKKDNGEIAKIQVEVDEEKARQLMVHFSTVRGDTSDAYFPTGYSPFGHLYPDNNYFTVRLADSVIEFTHLNRRRVIVDFSIQLVGVVS